jgi:hypothetical protein
MHIFIACDQEDKYFPEDNKNTYLHENVEEYTKEVVSEKIKEVGDINKVNRNIYTCNNLNSQLIGVIIKSNNTIKENNTSIPQSFYTLKMSHSCTFKCDDKGQNKEYDDITSIQIVFTNNIDTRYIEGKKARIVGQLFSAYTPYHQTEILISAKSLELL